MKRPPTPLNFRYSGCECPKCGSTAVTMLPDRFPFGLPGPLGLAWSVMAERFGLGPKGPRMGTYRMNCRSCGWRTVVKVL